MGWGGIPPPPPGKNDPGWLRVARDSCTRSPAPCLDEERITTMRDFTELRTQEVLVLPHASMKRGLRRLPVGQSHQCSNHVLPHASMKRGLRLTLRALCSVATGCPAPCLDEERITTGLSRRSTGTPPRWSCPMPR